MKSIAWWMGTAAAVGAAVAIGAMLAEAAGIGGSAQLAQNPPPARQPRAPAPAPSSAPVAPAQAAPAPGTAAGDGSREPAPAPVPTRTEILNLENWVVTCNEFAEGPHRRVCSALLHIVQQNTNQTVFSWTVAVESNKQMVTVIQTPTGVFIAPGVELKVGKQPPHKVPFTICDSLRCVASMPMDNALLHEMTVVPTAEAVIQVVQGNSVQFNIQLKGFDKAYTVLSKL